MNLGYYRPVLKKQKEKIVEKSEEKLIEVPQWMVIYKKKMTEMFGLEIFIDICLITNVYLLITGNTHKPGYSIFIIFCCISIHSNFNYFNEKISI